ncbi:MAG TPA: imidazole glycerol phosphate synthase cyclase subunit [Syntrophomonas sp.]|nr:imidazole glycerol phosphate synthase cyclase subunit [Syntrophomonas sp.]
MKNIRVIARLDIKGPNLVKGVQFEGLRKMGNPNDFARFYYQQGADEILYIDTVASLYNRNNLHDIVKETTRDVFIPITVGGGIRSLNDVREILRTGADKVAVNTAALKNPQLISDIAERFGAQCLVLSIQAKKVSEGKWEAYYDNGREKSGVDVLEWAQKGCELGAGEILLTSVDMEGTQKGFDYELVRKVSQKVPIPVIAGGGCGKAGDFIRVILDGKADAVAIASVFHYKQISISDLKEQGYTSGIKVRRTRVA